MQENKINFLDSVKLIVQDLKANNSVARPKLRDNQLKAGKLYVDHMQRKQQLSDGFKSRVTYSYLVLYSNFKSFTTILYSNLYTIIR